MTKTGIWTLGLMMLFPALKAQVIELAGPAESKVIYNVSKKNFPCRWRKKHINPGFTLLEEDEIKRTKEILDTALYKYPEDVLSINLKRVYVVRTLQFFGLDYGGTYSKRNIYLSDNGIENGYTDEFIEGTFHHEFSSVLLERHSTKEHKQSWVSANPGNFHYGHGGVEALRANATGLQLDPSLFEKGFLNEYSLASLEEDWNCYAEYIFLNDPAFWEAWEEHEAIKKKTELFIRFYHELNPEFTLEYFRVL